MFALNPMRTIGTTAIAENEIWLCWVLVIMHDQRAVESGTASICEPHFLFRRRQAYRLLRTHLEGNQTGCSSLLLYGTAFAAVAEARLGAINTAQQHLSACRTIYGNLKQHEVEDLESPMHIMLFNPFVCIGLHSYFATWESLQSALADVSPTLSMLQARRAEFRRNTQLETCATSHCRSQVVESEWSGLYRSRPSPVASGAVIRQLQRGLSDCTVVGTKLYSAVAYMLLLIFCSCRQNPSHAHRFVGMLHQNIIDSMPLTPGRAHAAPVFGQENPITDIGFLYLSFLCIQKFRQEHSKYAPSLSFWKAVDLVEAIALVPLSRQIQVKSSLIRSLLCTLGHSSDSNPSCIFNVEALKDEIESAWWSRRTDRV